jgi:hypothetical protein
MRIILKWMLKKYSAWVWNIFFCYIVGLNCGFCDQVNKISCTIKGDERLKHLIDYKLYIYLFLCVSSLLLLQKHLEVSS